jgi:hypothetical protein
MVLPVECFLFATLMAIQRREARDIFSGRKLSFFRRTPAHPIDRLGIDLLAELIVPIMHAALADAFPIDARQ